MMEVTHAAMEWERRGGHLVLETFTLSHRSGDSVAKQRLGLKVGWEAVAYGNFAKTHKEASQQGYLRVTEVTYGTNGPHLHLHVLRFVSSELTTSNLVQWGDKNFNQFSNALGNAGYRKPSDKFHDIRAVNNPRTIGAYLMKGYDNAKTNTSRSSGTMWDLLTASLAAPWGRETYIWRQWEEEAKGMRQITWSQNLRKHLGMVKEETDSKVVRTPYIALIEIEQRSIARYASISWLQPKIMTLLLEGDLSAVFAVLDEHGIEFSTHLNTAKT